MKQRIQYLYEKGGNDAWFQMMVNAENLSELLTKAEYTQKMYEYDRQSLEKYVNTIEQVTQLSLSLIHIFNLRAMKLVKDGGFLATCSCSHFMTYELFTKTIGQAARSAHKRLRQVEYRTQAPDHPILWASDESYYLKFYIFQVCSDK